MLHWLPAEPSSGHHVPTLRGQGLAPCRGSQPCGQSGRRKVLVQGRRARTGRRQWERQPLTSAQTFPSRPAPQLIAPCQDSAQHGPPGHKVTFWQHITTRTPPTPSKSNASPALSPTAWPGQPDSQPGPLHLSHLRGQYQNHQHMHSTRWCCRDGRGHGGHREG